MSTHHHDIPVGGIALGLFLGHETSKRQRSTGESYGKAASATVGYAVVGAILGPFAFGAAIWGLLMHPLVTIPSLFLLAWGFWWLGQPMKHQPVATASSPAPEPVLSDYAVTPNAHAVSRHYQPRGPRPIPPGYHRPIPGGLDVPKRP